MNNNEHPSHPEEFFPEDPEENHYTQVLSSQPIWLQKFVEWSAIAIGALLLMCVVLGLIIIFLKLLMEGVKWIT